MDTGISVLEWPSRSPDLNPTDNIWALLVRDVYAGFRQFECEDDLCEAIAAAWERIQVDTLKESLRQCRIVVWT